MTGIVGRMREAFRGEQRVDADDLVARLHAVRRFLAAVDGQVPDSRLVTAHTLVERAGTRLALSRDHTVVALAGATGSGKSSLFNALARLDLSPVGVRRPTTGVAHACVWGRLDDANRLLDWVGVLPRHRFVRESALDADDENGLHGLVLLDLPDFDSVQRSHRLEVDRLLGLVDLVVWVVDPQKYADRVIHTSYLREFHRHRDVTLVVLNQADRLSATELPRVLDDLRRLLDADGLDGVPLLDTTAVHPGGLTGLREALERAVSERQASLRRLSGDVDAVVAGLGELVITDVPRDAPDEDTVRSLDRAWPARPGCRRWPTPSRGRTGTGPAAPPAGRSSGAGAGCDRIRCAGCTCPARPPGPTSRRRAWSPRPRCPTRPPPSGPPSGWPSARSRTAPAPACPRPGRTRSPRPPGPAWTICRTRWTGRSPAPTWAWTAGRSGGGSSVASSGWSPSPRWPGSAGCCSATRCARSGCPPWSTRG